MREPPETSELQAFLSVADSGSISAAATELGLPRATVGRRLNRIEEKLGVELVNRTTRRVKLTEAGESFYPHAAAVVDALDVATRSVVGDTERPQGHLRISVPPLTARPFRALLLEFIDRYPAVDLEVIVSTQHEDLFAKNIDVAWRAGQALDPGLISRTLQRSTLIAVASPQYLAGAPALTSPDQLSQHACLVGFTRGEHAATHWPLRDGSRVRVEGHLVSNSLELLVEAALDSKGIALLPEGILGRLLREGQLQPILPDVLGTTTVVALVFQESRFMRPAVRAFVDFMVEKLAGNRELEFEL